MRWSSRPPCPRAHRAPVRRLDSIDLVLRRLAQLIDRRRCFLDGPLRVNFLISIREDAWAKLDRFKGAIPNLFGNYLRVDYLSWDSARRAIEGPVAEYNRQCANGDGSFAIDPALSEAVLEDVRTANLALAQVGDGTGEHESVAVPGEKQIETPFLQLVMQRLWDETVEQGARTLRLETLTQLGGAQEIVRSHLARYMDSLDEAQRKVAADVFRFLVTTSRTKISQRASDLADWTERPESEVVAVLERLSGGEQIRERGAGPPEGDETDRKSGEGRQPPDEGDPPASDRARILRPLRPPSGEEGTRYEIFHDVLAEAILDWRKRYRAAAAEGAREGGARRAAREGGGGGGGGGGKSQARGRPAQGAARPSGPTGDRGAWGDGGAPRGGRHIGLSRRERGTFQ